MISSSSNLNDNFAEGAHKIEKDFEMKGLSEYHFFLCPKRFLLPKKHVSKNI